MNEGGFIFLSEQELQGAPIMKALLSTEKKTPSTHEWVQLMGHGWHMPSSSGYFQMGM